MSTSVRVLLIALAASVFLLTPSNVQEKTAEVESPSEVEVREQLNTEVRQYLESKNSPLADSVESLTQLTHWKLLIAISAIESQYCKRQLSFNCWGIGGDSAYRHYNSFPEAAADADALITRWQNKGRWLTVEDMNCHYVVPCNPNWVRVVNLVLSELNALGTTTSNTLTENAE